MGRCADPTLHVHKHRNLLAHAPQRLHEEVAADYTDMIYATSPAEIEQRRRAFIRKWRLKCKAVADNSYALFAPAGTPAPILVQLHDATVAALALPDLRERLREQGAEVVGNSSAELAAYVAAEIPKWQALARQAGVKPE